MTDQELVNLVNNNPKVVACDTGSQIGVYINFNDLVRIIELVTNKSITSVAPVTTQVK